ncbi:DUF982 domain-containing protein [Mesorhizobium sp. CA6]|uniref:DUF982 domain-containing protein n=1 Tax=Mesorhizobium sp. CA6 TaxID=588500 RepID=UPI001CCBB182|nr:DUF982 domain-containing protein [Mesorhizobium sp. CA6]MBZ9766567.1 DUF982 domain-containing protein [Mesorhizobium sp. CA6]
MRTHGALWFSPPVSVKTRQTGVRYEVNNVQAAAENLLEWPERGRHWNRALQACLDLTPDDVRAAFETAARKEGMLLD